MTNFAAPSCKYALEVELATQPVNTDGRTGRTNEEDQDVTFKVTAVDVHARMSDRREVWA